MIREMMLCSTAGLLLASFTPPSKAAPAVNLGAPSATQAIENVYCRYVCWWKDGLYRKCDCAGPGYYRRYSYDRYYGRPYRHYYDEDDYRYRRWRYYRERGW
jgi:hypothetical protein